MSAFFRTCIFLYLIAACDTCLAQASPRLPKNLKNAVRILETRIDSINGELIKNTDLEALWHEAFESASPLHIISEWADDEHSFEGVNRYLKRKGLEDFTISILLHAIKDQVTQGHYDEAKILDIYCKQKCYNEEQDRRRSTADSLYGQYIPFNLEDCFRDLDIFLDDTTKRAIIKQSSEDFLTNSYFGLGTYLRNRWQLWGGSRLFILFYKQGICHPEPMSGYILGQYYNYLTKQPIVKYPDTNYCDSFQKAERLERERINDSTYAAFKLKDTVRFTFDYGYINDQQRDSIIDGGCEAIGLVIGKNDSWRALRVRILSTCSKKGFIIDDNKNVIIYDPATKQTRKPTRRKKVYAKDNDAVWTSYRHWELRLAYEDEEE